MSITQLEVLTDKHPINTKATIGEFNLSMFA